MTEFQIETAQNVGINQNIAHIGDRMLAYIVDSVIILFYTIAIILFLIALDFNMSDSWSIYLLMSLPAFLYYILLETFWNGQTVGKYMLNTRVVMLDGSKPGFSNYFIRWILRIIDVVLTGGSVALLTILIKGNGQRIGDMAARTTVISERKKVSLSDTILAELPTDYVPTYSQVMVLSDKDMQTIATLYYEALAKDNDHIIINLHGKLSKLMDVVPKEKSVDFVALVIKDYNYYTQNM